MATRKQRRRREKEKRHDYDLVEIDSEGNETLLTTAELKTNADGRKPSASRGGGGSTQRRGRGVAQPPSWPRVLKRGALFAPIFFATVLLLGGKNISILGAILNTLMLVAVFVPFSYFMDRVLWRSQEKRLAKTRGG